jgi:hypothetical protein
MDVFNRSQQPDIKTIIFYDKNLQTDRYFINISLRSTVWSLSTGEKGWKGIPEYKTVWYGQTKKVVQFFKLFRLGRFSFPARMHIISVAGGGGSGGY